MTEPIGRPLSERLDGEVLADEGTRSAYASDASNHRVVPLCVVLPRSVDDVATAVTLCSEAGVPITSRGAGTSIAGSAIGPGVVLDFSRHLNRIVSVDPDSQTATVEPGVVLDQLQLAAQPHGLRFGPDPSSHNRCTIGGMIGTNACGSHSVAWGTTADSVNTLDVLLADGSPSRLGRTTSGRLADDLGSVRDGALAPIRRHLGRFPRQISGYALQHLLPENGFDLAKAFVGSEGTCAVVVSATVRLVRLPAHRTLVVAGFPDDVSAAAAAPELAGLGPLTVEGIGDTLVRAFDTRPGPQPRPDLPAGRAWLLMEVGGPHLPETTEAAAALARAARGVGALEAVVLTSATAQQALWLVRERGAGLATRTAAGTEAWPGWEDSAVPPERLADYLRDLHRLLADHGRAGVVYGHFGEGCVHLRIDHDLRSRVGRVAYRSFQEEAAELVIAHGGSLSGEHGDGRARSELLARMYGDDLLAAFGAFKRAFDPDNLFNPGILVDPDPLDAHLRLEVNRSHRVDLAFGYRADDGDWGKAMRRCVGVGACRKETGGGMCPSYRATKDELHSTRGRARLLFEMLDGHLGHDGWRSEDVHQALDLCLSCKACSSECPVSVDMATYKAEFLHHHYRHRLRPRAHYSMGWVPLWLALARRTPRLANAVLGRAAMSRLGGLDPRRPLPRLSADRDVLAATRRRVAAKRHTQRRVARPVLLWVDTFTASFAPSVVADAVDLLEAAGYAVQIPERTLCCALTWVSTGQLDVARRVMRRTVAALAASGDIPVVALEPSCGAALRTDVPELLATPEADRLAGRVRMLAEALDGHELDLAPLAAPAVAQFHCHQRAVTGTTADLAVLARLGVDVTSVDEGCCGLAGNFGFELGHYDVSLRCAEQSFLPVLRGTAADTVVLADGFSCRLQIAQLTGREPLHLAQLLRRQLRAG